MNRYRIHQLVVIVFALLCITSSVSAQSSVKYDGESRKFIFSPGSNYSPTDLFSDLKSVMPGDSITQRIVVKNSESYNKKIRLYLRSEGGGESDFLSKLTMTVRQEGNSNMFAAPASEKAQMSDWVELGTVYSGGEINIDVTITVPKELGNEYQNAVGSIGWTFKVDELPVEETDPIPAKTGSKSNAVLATICLCAGCVFFVLRRKSIAADRF